MNERIRELADEAAKFSAVMALPTGESGDKLFVEKFAELIVKGCVEVIDAQTTVWRNTGIPAEVALDMAKENVKAYFGVQE